MSNLNTCRAPGAQKQRHRKDPTETLNEPPWCTPNLRRHMRFGCDLNIPAPPLAFANAGLHRTDAKVMGFPDEGLEATPAEITGRSRNSRAPESIGATVTRHGCTRQRHVRQGDSVWTAVDLNGKRWPGGCFRRGGPTTRTRVRDGTPSRCRARCRHGKTTRGGDRLCNQLMARHNTGLVRLAGRHSRRSPLRQDANPTASASAFEDMKRQLYQPSSAPF